MINLNKNKKANTLFILAICTVSIDSKLSALPLLPENPTARVVAYALAIGIPSFIRLYTKGTPKELKFKTELHNTWENRFNSCVEILKVWNVILKPSKYIKLIDECWIGTQLSLADEEVKEISECGRKEITITGKKVRCLPTGVCGSFDTYVLKQCKDFYDAIGNMGKAFSFYCFLHGIGIEKLS